MDYGKVFRNSWEALWKLKFLWVFGFLLAMTTTTSSGWWLLSNDNQEIDPGITFKLDGDRVYRIIGEGIVVDFTGEDAPRIGVADVNLQGLEGLQAAFDELQRLDLWVIPVFAGIGLLIIILTQALLRYSSEAAVIHSVDEFDKSDTKVGFRQAFRYGWSRTAARLFGIDLAIFLGVILFTGSGFLMALGPVLLALWSGNEAAIILGASLTFMLLIGWTFILAFTILGSTLIRQVSWRACGIERLGVWASIQSGFRHLEADFPHLILAWIIWLSVGLVWLLLLIPMAIALFPLLLLSISAGLAAGFFPALFTWGIASLYVSELTAFVLAVLVGLPIFALVTVSPILFIGGLVRLFQSNIWTLAYRALPVVSQRSTVKTQSPEDPELKALPAS